MANNQQIFPIDANVNQSVLNAFNELHIKEELSIKEETHDFEVREILYLPDQILQKIIINDIIVLGTLAHSEEVLGAMNQPGGILKTNAQAMVRAGKEFIKLMKKLLTLAQNYETVTQMAPDYDLQDETKTCSLGWYVRLVRQTIAQENRFEAAILLYRNSTDGSIAGIGSQYNDIGTFLSRLRAHARHRYPNHNNYITQFGHQTAANKEF